MTKKEEDPSAYASGWQRRDAGWQ